MLEVVDLPVLRKQKKYIVLRELNPYPGIIYLHRWEGDKLIVGSDMPLNLKNKDKNFDLDKQLKKDKIFSINISSGAICEAPMRKIK